MSFSIPSDDQLRRVMAFPESPSGEFPSSVDEQIRGMIERIGAVDCYGPREREISQADRTMQELFSVVDGLEKELNDGEDELNKIIGSIQKLQGCLTSLQSELKKRRLYNRNVQPIYQWGEIAATRISR